MEEIKYDFDRKKLENNPDILQTIVPAKLHEHMINNSVVDQLEEKGIMNIRQHVLTRKRGTETVSPNLRINSNRKSL